MTVRILPRNHKNALGESIRQMIDECVSLCMQCGVCSAVCPMTDHMDVLPRMIMRRVQLELEDRLEGLKTYWVCSSCYACQVQCPRGIDIPRVMEALRLTTLRKNKNHIEPSALPVDVLADCPQIALVAAFRKATS